MEEETISRTGAVYGIDISEDRALISYINPDQKEPTTVSTERKITVCRWLLQSARGSGSGLPEKRL